VPKLVPTYASRRRRGCLGCLGGCFVPLAGLLVAAPIFIALVLAVFAPWGYFLGGAFHPVPAWVGVGRLHAKSGDFVLYVEMSPSPSGRFGQPSVTGQAFLYTPKGERINLKMGGSFLQKWIGLVPEGRAMHLWLHRRVGPTINARDNRPRFDLHGTWRGRDLVLSDDGTLSQAFLPDGRAWFGRPNSQPAVRETLAVTLVPIGWWEYSCLPFTGNRR
jgi:hypothetical protein